MCDVNGQLLQAVATTQGEHTRMLTRLEGRVMRIEDRLEGVEGRLGGVEGRLDRVETKVTEILVGQQVIISKIDQVLDRDTHD